LLDKDKSGHGFDHVSRVYTLAIKFAEQENAKSIMQSCKVDDEIQKRVLDIISNMGFSKCLKGIRPKTLEGQIVSDADMCDAIGSSGIIRSVAYSVSEKGSGTIFDKDILPIIDITQEKYNSGGGNYTQHRQRNKTLF